MRSTASGQPNLLLPCGLSENIEVSINPKRMFVVQSSPPRSTRVRDVANSVADAERKVQVLESSVSNTTGILVCIEIINLWIRVAHTMLTVSGSVLDPGTRLCDLLTFLQWQQLSSPCELVDSFLQHVQQHCSQTRTIRIVACGHDSSLSLT